MRKFKKALAMLLVLAMVLALVPAAFAVQDKAAPAERERTERREIPSRKVDRSLGNLEKAVRNSQYDDDDIVSVIVLLEGAPVADAAENNAEKASCRVKVANEQNAVLNSMKGMDYKLRYRYDSLLNGFAMEVPYGEIDAIAALPGVASVQLSRSYNAPDARAVEDTKTLFASIANGNFASAKAGFNGAGIVVAVIDTGLNASHEVFQDTTGLCAKTARLTEDDIAVAAAPGKYLSAKVPFTYDYADHDDDVTDQEGHGTHVSGTTVGYAVDEDGAILFQGAAPAAQLLSLKVFKDAKPGAADEDILAALEDAYRLGADVVNMSLGSQNGFTYDDSLANETFGNVYLRLQRAGTILSISAGNEGTMSENFTNNNKFAGPEYMDYGTVGSPATYTGNVSVAAMENSAYPSFAVSVDGNRFCYVDSSTDLDDTVVGYWLDNFALKEVPFEVVPDGAGGIALGTPADYENVDVTGKIAVVQRGVNTFSEKVLNAGAAGAVGVIICNNEPGSFGMVVDDYCIPAIAVTEDTREYFLNAKNKTLYTDDIKAEVDNVNAFAMSTFSSWGPSPDLTIDPVLTSFGGRINSSVPGGTDTYEVYDGTSMAAPNLTGMFANVLSWLESSGFEGTKAERADVAKALLESTAEILVNEKDIPYAVRQQGAGRGDSMNAITTYKSAGYITDPIKELGDDPEKTGVYSFDVNFRNDSHFDAHYSDFETIALADSIGVDASGNPFNTRTSGFLDNTAVYKIDGKEVKEFDLPAGGNVKVNVTLTVSAEDKEYLDMFPNGAFVEGYVCFRMNQATTETTYENHATFLTFYGDWTEASAFEAGSFEDWLMARPELASIPLQAIGVPVEELGLPADTTIGDFAFYAGITVEEVMEMLGLPVDALVGAYTKMNTGYLAFIEGPASEPQEDIFLGTNPLYEYGYSSELTPWNPAYMAFSTDFYAQDNGIAFFPYQLRNLEHIIMTVSNKETGEVYYVDDTPYSPKARYDLQQTSWDQGTYFQWNGTDIYGDIVPSDTVVHVQFDGVLPYNDTLKEDIWSMDVTVDNDWPVVTSAVLDREAGTLTVTAEDNQYISGIFLCDENNDIVAAQSCAPENAGDECTVVFDVADLLGQNIGTVYAGAMDYATNQEFFYENDEAEFPEFFTLYDPSVEVNVMKVIGNADPVIETVPQGTVLDFSEPDVSFPGYEFAGWVTEPLKGPVAPEDAADLDIYGPGRIAMATQDSVFFALYVRGEWTIVDKTNYFMPADIDNYSTCAFAGFDENGDMQILGSDLEAVNAFEIDDFSFEDPESAAKFFTEETGLHFNVEHFEDPDFIISFYRFTADDGRALCLNKDGSLGLGDPSLDSAKWVDGLELADALGADTSLIELRDDALFYSFSGIGANELARLAFDEESGEFGILQDDLASFILAGMPSEEHVLYLYSRDASFFTPEYYTTDLEHIHTVPDDAKIVDATCTEPGSISYVCPVCGEEVTEEIPAKGHTVPEDPEAYTVIKEPTCAEAGEATYVCPDCGETVTVEIPKLDHKWDAGTLTKAPTCTEDGTAVFTCELCGETMEVVVPATGHDWDNGVVTTEPTCDKEGVKTYTCRTCGETVEVILPALGDHSWDEGKVTKAPTCTEDGEKTYTCLVCGETRVEKLPNLGGHKLVKTEGTAATVTKNGNIEYWTCPVCGKIFSDAEGKNEIKFADTVIPAKGVKVEFEDCPEDAWYMDYVRYMARMNFMGGIAEGFFGPNDSLTRAMMVTVLYRAAGSPEVSEPCTFKDVPVGQWYSDAIAWAEDHKIVNGIGDDLFAPDKLVTRQDIATILWRASGEEKVNADMKKFGDADKIMDYARDAMSWAVDAGILNGDRGNLKPLDFATRAEFAAMFMRYEQSWKHA